MRMWKYVAPILFSVISTASHGMTYTPLNWRISRATMPPPVCAMNASTCLSQIGTLNVNSGVWSPAGVSGVTLGVSATIAILRASTPIANNCWQILGYYAAGDGGGGVF